MNAVSPLSNFSKSPLSNESGTKLLMKSDRRFPCTYSWNTVQPSKPIYEWKYVQ